MKKQYKYQSVKAEIHFELEKAKEFEKVDKGVLRWFVAFKKLSGILIKGTRYLYAHFKNKKNLGYWFEDIWIVPPAKKKFNKFLSDLQQKEIKTSHPRSVNTEEGKDIVLPNEDEVVKLVNKYYSGGKNSNGCDLRNNNATGCTGSFLNAQQNVSEYLTEPAIMSECFSACCRKILISQLPILLKHSCIVSSSSGHIQRWLFISGCSLQSRH
ncbi:hypothetical protein C1646_755764 [Rhizophagus diaphanus]|nr:hypothetical protein C1646_755764 [Rhizophagus diaphanus] [Rhizophagus sp. MUCL 43196]